MNEKLLDVLKHEGVVSIISWGSADEPHVTNTWNSYIVVKDDRFLIPAAGMTSTEADVVKNPRVKVTLGAREVEGFNGYQGTGFRIEGTAEFISEGAEYDEMFEKYPFLKRVLAIRVNDAKQLL